MSSRQLQHEANHYNRLSIRTTHKMTGKHQSKIMPFISISLSNTIHFSSERWNTKHPIFVRFAFVKWNEREKIITLVPIVALIIVFFILARKCHALEYERFWLEVPYCLWGLCMCIVFFFHSLMLLVVVVFKNILDLKGLSHTFFGRFMHMCRRSHLFLSMSRGTRFFQSVCDQFSV